MARSFFDKFDRIWPEIDSVWQIAWRAYSTDRDPKLAEDLVSIFKKYIYWVDVNHQAAWSNVIRKLDHFLVGISLRVWACELEAGAFYSLGRYQEAIDVLKTHLLPLLLEDEQTNLAKLVQTYSNLALFHLDWGQPANAVEWIDKAVRLTEGVENISVESRKNLLLAMARYSESQNCQGHAEDAFEGIIALERLNLDRSDTDGLIPALLLRMAITAKAEGREVEASRFIDRLQAFLAASPDTIDMKILTARLHEFRGNYCEARATLGAAVDRSIEVYGSKHWKTAGVIGVLAEQYEQERNYEEAERLYQLELQIRKDALNGLTESLSIAEALIGLGRVSLRLNKFEKAEGHLKKALDIQQKLLGPDHIDLATPLIGLSRAYQGQARYEQAEAVGRRALALRRRSPQNDGPELAEAFLRLGTVLRLSGNLQEAAQVFEEMIQGNVKCSLPDEPTTRWQTTQTSHYGLMARALRQLGKIYFEESRVEEGASCYEQAIAIREKVFGVEHRSTLSLKQEYWDFTHPPS